MVTLFYDRILLICDKWLYGEYLRLIHDSATCSSQDECKCERLHNAVVAYRLAEQMLPCFHTSAIVFQDRARNPNFHIASTRNRVMVKPVKVLPASVCKIRVQRARDLSHRD